MHSKRSIGLWHPFLCWWTTRMTHTNTDTYVSAWGMLEQSIRIRLVSVADGWFIPACWSMFDGTVNIIVGMYLNMMLCIHIYIYTYQFEFARRFGLVVWKSGNSWFYEPTIFKFYQTWFFFLWIILNTKKMPTQLKSMVWISRKYIYIYFLVCWVFHFIT